jgi:hypothetical protein
MKLKHIETGEVITCTRRLYYKYYRDCKHLWLDVTPEPTEAQKKVQEAFVKLGTLYRTRANIQSVIEMCGSHHGLFFDAIKGINYYIKEIRDEIKPKDTN